MSEQFAPPPFEHSGLSIPEHQPESFSLPRPEVFNSRSELVFAPVIDESTDSTAADANEYDFMFDADEERYATAQAEYAQLKKEERAKLEGRARVSEEYEKFSLSILDRFDHEPQLDSKIKEIIRRYNGDQQLGSEQTMRTIRSNKYLRMELGSYFLQKLDNYNDILPPRVQSNGQKKPGLPGYENIPMLRSREYASLLALAQIDGTFDVDRSLSDAPTYKDGEIKTGQHRVASQVLLYM